VAGSNKREHAERVLRHLASSEVAPALRESGLEP